MKRNRLNHNREIMMGVMALAVVVLGVVIFFWMWCFPNGTPHANTSQTSYCFLLTDGFRGDSVRLRMNDSVVFNRTVHTDSFEVSVQMPKGDCFLMVELPEADMVSSFELPSEGAVIGLRNRNGHVDMQLLK